MLRIRLLCFGVFLMNDILIMPNVDNNKIYIIFNNPNVFL